MMSKESLKETLRTQSQNFEKMLQLKMRYFNEGEKNYFVLEDWIWDRQPKENLQVSTSNLPKEDQVIEKGRLSYSPASYQERLDILQEEAEMEIYKRAFLE